MSQRKDIQFINQIAQHPLQTWEWAEFRKAWGNEVIWTKYGILTIHKIFSANFRIGIFVKGPKPTQRMLNDLKELAKKQNLIFIKLEPNLYFKPHLKSEKTSPKFQLIELLKKNGCVEGKNLFTPTTFIIDLEKDEDEIFKNFHHKTRYNIRLAQKYGVKVIEDNSNKAFEKYLSLTKETIQRQGFYAHSERYHRLMWEYLHKIPVSENRKPIAHLLTAIYKKEIITTWIVFVWKRHLYYPYGASSNKYKNVMANNLMMWEAILFGKRLGLKIFDLWGREEGKGFTRFKEGYNPEVVEFLGSWDLVINKPMYKLYRLGEQIRWPILRLKSKLVKPRF